MTTEDTAICVLCSKVILDETEAFELEPPFETPYLGELNTHKGCYTPLSKEQRKSLTIEFYYANLLCTDERLFDV